jgi:hypothetical protein
VSQLGNAVFELLALPSQFLQEYAAQHLMLEFHRVWADCRFLCGVLPRSSTMKSPEGAQLRRD